MTIKEIEKEIIRLKLLPQTPQVKLKIQRLQQQLNEN
tara:strand:- start:518 stop:628 length:111 start_codon:yes stop_codon:yes gene_type:complete